MFGAKCSKTNWFQNIIEYKTNEHSTKYLNWNMFIEKCGMFGNITRKY